MRSLTSTLRRTIKAGVGGKGSRGPLIIGMLLVLATVIAFNCHRATGAAPIGYRLESFTSMSDLAEGEKRKSESGKDQILAFFMNGCPHCDKVMPQWTSYKQSATDVETCEYEVSSAPNACKTYGITGFPSFVRADANGNVLSRDRPF